MLSREEIATILAEYKFTQWATITNSSGKWYQYIEETNGTNLFVNPQTKDFYMEWLIPHTVISIKCPKCAPIDNVGHFKGFYNQMVKYVGRVKDGSE